MIVTTLATAGFSATSSAGSLHKIIFDTFLSPTAPSVTKGIELKASSAQGALAPQQGTNAATAMNSSAGAARQGHTATLLGGGQVLVVGGDAGGTAEVFDAATGTHAVTGGLSLARFDHTATKLADGRVIVIGGRSGGTAEATTEIYNTTTGSFEAGPSMSVARAGHSATLLSDGKILVAGGDAAGSAEVYDPAANSFSAGGAAMGVARSGHSAALMNDGRVIVVGGRDAGGNELESAEIYNGSGFSATGNAMAHHRVRAHLRVLPDGKVQVIGGNDDDSMEVYDPAVDVFGAHGHLIPVTDPDAALLEDDILGAQTRAAFFHHGQADAVRDREGHTITEIPQLGKAVVLGGVNTEGAALNSASILNSSAATVTTDKLDYAPGQTATISGTGWQPNEVVNIILHEDPHTHTERRLAPQANAEGDFSANYLVDSHDFQVTFIVGAKGASSSRTAQTTFTDGNLNIFTSGPSYTLVSDVYNSANCTGSVPTNTSQTVTLASNAQFSINANTKSYKLTVQGPPAGFTNWTTSSLGTGVSVFSNVGNVLCLNTTSPSGSGNATANFSTAATALTVGPASGAYGGTANLSATLKTPNASGAGVSGKTISFTLNGNSVGSAITNASGVATLSNVSLAGINAGSYPAGVAASFAGDASFLASSGSNSLTVSKAATTTTVTCGVGPFTFTGAAQTPCTATVTGAGGLNQSLTVNYTNNTNAGTATASASYAESANHLGSSDSENFTIDKASSTTVVTCPTNVTYTGAAQTPCSAVVTGVGGLNQSLTVSYSNNTNAGTASASATFAGDTNHTGSNDSKNFTIDPAASTTVVTCPTNVTYTGAAQTPCTATVTGAGGLNQSLTVNYANNTDAGTATASASFAGDANHLGSSDSENFTIDKATTTTTVTCPTSVTYDGSALEPCTATVTGPGALNQSLTVSYSNNTSAGTAIASASYAETANYFGSSDSKNFTIDKAASTTVVTCPASATFTGAAIEPCSATVTGAGGLNQSLTVSYTNNVNAGAASASATYAESANHLGSSDSKNFTIEKAATTTVVTCPTNVTYTGAAIEPCTATVTGPALSESLTVNYTNNTNAGAATASAAYAESANYLGSSDSENFTIDKAATVTTVSCPTNVTYTGAALEPCAATVTGAGGLNEALTVNYTNNTNAGAATASATYAESANYLGSSDSKNFTIDKAATTTVVTCPASATFTGSAIEPCSAAVTGAGGLNQPLTVSYTDNVNAGTATASASYAGDANYLGSSDSKNFTIERAATTTTVTCPTNITYTGAAIEPCTATVTGPGGLNESLTVGYTDNVNAGAATASATYAETANYLGSSDSENFTIDKAATTTTVTCPTSVTYDGSAQTPCSASVTGAGGLNQSLT
ncbi:MAG TPA: kelch repeat-containing protein, partial [Pyrinomonadaceae bacterium]